MRLRLAALALAIGLVLLSASAEAGRNLTIGITQFPSTLHPSIDSMMAKSYVLGLARRPITVYDADWNLVCLVCTELPTLANGGAVLEKTREGGKGIAVTYRLHPQATWGDGTPVSTDDILFTWEFGKHPQSGVANSELYRRILAVDVKDDKTFTLHFDRVEFTYNAINDFAILPAHLEREIFRAAPGEYRNRTRFDTDSANPGLYFGPYRITQVNPGASVVLEKNPTWWGKPPAFDRITVRTIENTAALEANLLSGEIDMIAGELGLTVDQALSFEKRHGRRFNVSYKPGLIYEHLDVNLGDPILSDLRVRRALMMGMDRQAIASQLFEGRQPVAATMVSPLDPMFADDLQGYAYDPERAALLLNEAGYDRMIQGVRQNAKGRRLSIELMTTAGNRTRELVEQVLQSQWQQLGIEVTIRNQPARVFFGETVSRRKFQSLAMFAWISSPENVPRSTLHSAQVPSAENGWSGQNYTGFSNPEMDKLIDRLEVELDEAARRTLWREVQRIYLEELPALPLYFRADAFILPKWLDGLRPTGQMAPSTLWVEDWSVRP